MSSEKRFTIHRKIVTKRDGYEFKTEVLHKYPKNFDDKFKISKLGTPKKISHIDDQEVSIQSLLAGDTEKIKRSGNIY